MAKRIISTILLAMLILIGCSNKQTSKIPTVAEDTDKKVSNISTEAENTVKKVSKISTEAENTVKKVSKIYGEQNPKITVIETTQAENTNEPMYIVSLTGNFQKGEQKSQKLQFSITKEGKKVWALECDSWQEGEVNITN